MARMTPPAALAAMAVALLLGLAPAARAGVILQPASASTNMGNAGAPTVPDNTRNQSGLSAGYTSLATDFDAYIAGGPTHDTDFSTGTTIWGSQMGFYTGNFDFGLGGTFTIESFALWNLGENGFNFRGFELLADDNAAFGSPTSLGSFEADSNTGPLGAVRAQVFTFSPTSASFVRMRITSVWTGATATGFGEAAFEVQGSPTAVPEPGSLALLTAGGLGLLGFARRRRARAG